MSALYYIESKQTNYFVFSDGNEQTGGVVAVLPDLSDDDKVVTISPPTDESTVLATIMGKAGLYASAPSESDGETIVWSEDPFTWEVTYTAQGFYEIFVPGKDLYWFSETNIGNILVLKSGSQAVENEIFFGVSFA